MYWPMFVGYGLVKKKIGAGSSVLFGSRSESQHIKCEILQTFLSNIVFLTNLFLPIFMLVQLLKLDKVYRQNKKSIIIFSWSGTWIRIFLGGGGRGLELE